MYIPLWLIIVGAIVLFIYLRNREKEKAQNIPLTPEEQESEESLRKINKHWQHEADVNSFFDLNKFDEALKLHEDKISKIKYYPNWYENSKKEEKAPYWKSKAIQPEELILKKFSSSIMKKLVDKSDKFGKDDD